MKTHYQLVTLVILLSLGLSEQVQKRERLCGRNLADALDLVCFQRGFYWDGMAALSRRRKRSSEILYNKRGRHGRRGVVQECCYNECSYDTLESYCARPGQTMSPGSRLVVGRTTTRPIQSLIQSYESSSRPVVSQSTPRPRVTTTQAVFPSAEFIYRPFTGRKAFFYVQVGTRPTRSPLI